MPSLFCGAPLGSLADAVLYLGQEKDQTQSLWNPAIYLDPEYWAELRRRNAIMGNHVDLAKQYRQEQSVRQPVPARPRGPPTPRPRARAGYTRGRPRPAATTPARLSAVFAGQAWRAETVALS